MNQPSNPQDKKSVQADLSRSIASVSMQVGCLTLLLMGAGFFVGRWLDQVLQTSNHVILIALVLGSAPLSLVLTYYIVMHETRQSRQPPIKDETPGERKENNTGE